MRSESAFGSTTEWRVIAGNVAIRRRGLCSKPQRRRNIGRQHIAHPHGLGRRALHGEHADAKRRRLQHPGVVGALTQRDDTVRAKLLT